MLTQHIIPAIIPDSYDRLQSRLREVRGAARQIQIDVLNGTFAPTTSWPYSGVDREAFEAIRREDEGLPYWQEFDFEIDLMVREPEEHLEEWALAGAARVIVHAESTKKLDDIIAYCYDRRIELALAVKPSTDLTLIEPYVERSVFVQCMGNDRIGYYGVDLDPRAVEQIKAVHARWPHVLIGVDIGVNEETLPMLWEAGARRFAVGSAIFASSDPAGEWKRLEKSATG